MLGRFRVGVIMRTIWLFLEIWDPFCESTHNKALLFGVYTRAPDFRNLLWAHSISTSSRGSEVWAVVMSMDFCGVVIVRPTLE